MAKMLRMSSSREIRLHGRGGQGGVTCAKILAAMYARLGQSVQTFGDYAGERSGAPVRAYTRVSDEAITNRNKVYEPDDILVLDPTLIGPELLEGLKPGGSLLINSSEPVEAFADRYPDHRIGVVDATGIARKHGIGTRSLVIVNTTIAGAFARMQELPLALLEETYTSLGFHSNFDAGKEAYENTWIREALEGATPEVATARAPSPAKQIEPLQEHHESPKPLLKTGSWKTQHPIYVENLAPCNAWCPAGNDVVGFIQSVAAGEVDQAAQILATTTPFPGVCGRVCPAPCMEGCNRREYDGSVQIRGLERWISDREGNPKPEIEVPAQRRSIGIVGAGPAGLSAAYTLALKGHEAHVYEGEKELGGVLRTGIPSYRLPREIIDREIGNILDLGVEAHTGTFLSSDELLALQEQHDALILSTGLQQLRELDLSGAGLAGVEQGIHFLHRVNLEEPEGLHGHVVVLGGGNTALDCARSALRSGAERVTIAYRRTREEMPAIREEIEEALEEGIELRLQLSPLGFVGADRVEAVRLAEVDMGTPDETGRRRPVVSDRELTIECDHVLLALGQSADRSFLPPDWKLDGDRILIGDDPQMIFGAGDIATGDGTVTHAIGNGRRAAHLALEALGEDVMVFARPDRERSVPITDIRLDHFERRTPSSEQHLEPEARARHFDEVNGGLVDGGEAHRCFSCGHCTRCDTCLVYCPEGIVRRDADSYEVDYSYCKGCGICVEECPRKAMEMTR